MAVPYCTQEAYNCQCSNRLTVKCAYQWQHHMVPKQTQLSKLILPGCETYQGNIMLYQIKPIIKVHIPWRQNVRQHRTVHNMRQSGYIWPGCETYQWQHRSMHNMGTLHLYQWQHGNTDHQYHLVPMVHSYFWRSRCRLPVVPTATVNKRECSTSINTDE